MPWHWPGTEVVQLIDVVFIISNDLPEVGVEKCAYCLTNRASCLLSLARLLVVVLSITTIDLSDHQKPKSVLLLRCVLNGSTGTSHPWPSDLLFRNVYDVKQECLSVSSRWPAQSWVCRRLGRRIIANFDDDAGIPRPHFGTVTSVGVGRSVFGVTYEDGDREDFCESPACLLIVRECLTVCVVLCAALGQLKACVDKTSRRVNLTLCKSIQSFNLNTARYMQTV